MFKKLVSLGIVVAMLHGIFGLAGELGISIFAVFQSKRISYVDELNRALGEDKVIL